MITIQKKAIKLHYYLNKNSSNILIDDLVEYLENNNNDLLHFFSNLVVYDKENRKNSILLKCIDESLIDTSKRYYVNIEILINGLIVEFIDDQLTDCYNYE